MNISNYIYYTIQKNSEAMRRLKTYLDKAHESRCLAEKLARKVGATDHSTFIVYDGKIKGFMMERQPDGWKRARRGDFRWYFPRYTKENKKLLEEISAIELASNVGIAKAIFGDAKLHFHGMSAIHGVGYEKIGERHIISFANEDHVSLYRDADWPTGLRRIKPSTVVAWEEAAAQ